MPSEGVRAKMDKLKRVLTGQDDEEEQGIMAQVIMFTNKLILVRFRKRIQSKKSVYLVLVNSKGHLLILLKIDC